ncbi:MAG TPA: competence/damage-inducible protein A [Saprospiraceae bacterium]|nr:competence/damage-inducible protein A [Saprospiraceae bacterium]
MKTNLITIGDEILIGQIIDTNSAWMATELNQMGAEVEEILSIPDDLRAIKKALSRGFAQADLLLMTGGLGPTKDDITKKAIAEYFGVNLTFHQPTYERIQKLFERWGRSTTEAHRQQCFMPENAELLYNKMGTAPGMLFEKGHKILVSMPGVPYEMQYIMEKHVLPRIKKQNNNSFAIAHRTILTVGEGESRIASRIEAIEDELPENIKLAYLPGLGRVRLRLSARGKNPDLLATALNEQVSRIQATIPELIFGYEKTSLEEAIGALLMKHEKTISTAESCTGGYLAHIITSVPGSSRYFQGSVVAYANEVKQRELQVKAKTLEEQGAVSEPTVREMVKGALEKFQTDLAVAISGIAGPDGGTPEKPVGTIWIAVGDRENTETLLLNAGKDRVKNIQYTAVYALDQVRKFVQKHYETDS